MKGTLVCLARCFALAAFAGASMAYAQVSMPSSPVIGNPVNLAVNIANSVGPITMVIHATSGQIQGSCYLGLETVIGGFRVKVYETSSGAPENPQQGNIGWQSQIGSSVCAVDLAASTWDWTTGIVLRLNMNPSYLGSKQVWVEYLYRVCDEWCSSEWRTATIGTWYSSPPGPISVLTQPAAGSVLPDTTATFNWTPATGATQYCLLVGRTVGGSEIANSCSGQLSAMIGGLPADGLPVYVSLRTEYAGQAPATSQYTFTAVDQSAPAVLVQPANRLLTTPSLSLVWSPGTNVREYRVVVTAGSTILKDTTLRAVQTRVDVPIGTAEVLVEITSFLPKGALTQSYVLRPQAGDDGPTISQVQNGDTMTFTWTPAGVGSYFLVVGKAPGQALVYPGSQIYHRTSVAVNDFATTSTSLTVNIAGFRDGLPLYVNLWWKVAADDTSWSLKAKVVPTDRSGPVAHPSGSDPAVILVALSSRYQRAISWDAGQGVSSRWLTVGTGPGEANLYNSYNDAIPGVLTERFTGAVAPIPDVITTVYATLYSKIGDSWYPRSYQFNLDPLPGASKLPQSFYDCVAGTAAVCRMPEGTFAIDTSGPTASTAFASPPIEVSRSNLTIEGGEMRLSNGIAAVGQTRLIRLGAAPGNCEPIIRISRGTAGVSHVTIRNLVINGNNQSFADTCSSPQDQPNIADVMVGEVATPLLPPLDLTGIPSLADVALHQVLFQDAPGRALLIHGPNLTRPWIGASRFRNAALTGLLVYSPWDPEDTPTLAGTTVCDAMNPVTQHGVVNELVIAWSSFENSWTGAIAFNYGNNLTVDHSWFSGNYWNPYDYEGGTIFVDKCTRDTKIRNSFFDGTGLTTQTQGLEIHSRGVEIKNNEIWGYPLQGVALYSTADVTLENNRIWNNGQDVGAGNYRVGVRIANKMIVAGANRRRTNNIVFKGNQINNGHPDSGTAYLPVRQLRAIWLSACDKPAQEGLVCDSLMAPIGGQPATLNFSAGVLGVDGVVAGTGVNLLQPNSSLNLPQICRDSAVGDSLTVLPSSIQLQSLIKDETAICP